MYQKSENRDDEDRGREHNHCRAAAPRCCSHSTFTREWGDKWTVTCSDDAKSLCKSLHFRNISSPSSSSSSSFGTHSLLNSRLWVRAIPSPSVSPFLPSFLALLFWTAQIPSSSY